MSDIVCIIQEGQEAERKMDALGDGLRRLGQEHFGDDPVAAEVGWTVVRKGFGWTAGEPSTSSIVIRSVPVGLPLERRTAWLESVCNLWSDVTGCSVNEIVATAWDGPLPL